MILFQRLKGLVRPRPSSTTPLGRAVFGRSTPKQQNDVINRDYLHDMMALNQAQIIPNRNRTFLMDSQVMYTVVRYYLLFDICTCVSVLVCVCVRVCTLKERLCISEKKCVCVGECVCLRVQSEFVGVCVSVCGEREREEDCVCVCVC